MLTFKLIYHSSLNLTSYIRHNCFYWQQVGKATLHVLKITKIQGDTFDKFGGKKNHSHCFIINYVRVGVEWFKMLLWSKHFILFRVFSLNWHSLCLFLTSRALTVPVFASRVRMFLPCGHFLCGPTLRGLLLRLFLVCVFTDHMF